MQPLMFIKLCVLQVQTRTAVRDEDGEVKQLDVTKPLNEDCLVPIHQIESVNTLSAVKYKNVHGQVKCAVRISASKAWLVAETLEEVEEMIRDTQANWAVGLARRNIYRYG